ncbi:hypothetical protein LR48_Vigan34s001100 [Vigna angularis]|uniref:Uncharacterized protein n=1 Tax=Phaseolus angularis TaxID=3914 RepID=A0A0L9T335_PHAAN|nr:hypothetical protein LR48_Vigan34s001100 [Vigna angularis]
MVKKRKRSESGQVVAHPKQEDAAPKRPVRTLLGWKDKSQVTDEVEDNNVASPIFRNKEKVLVTCSRRISYSLRTEKPWICKKAKDLYLWMAKCPSGPFVKFLVSAGITGHSSQ